MKRLLPVVFGLFLAGCSFGPEKAGVEIMSTPEAKVYIDGKEAGMTPYKNYSLQPKEVEIRLVTDRGEWSRKIRLQNQASTVIQREFGKEEKYSGGYILYLEPTGDGKRAGLLVSSQPDRATIKIDDEVKGLSPMKWEDIGEGEKQVRILYPAHKPVIVYAKGINGYQLLVDADLIEDEVNYEPIATPTISQQQITIKETETGWLRVRGQANGFSAEVGRVVPGETYEILSTEDDYFEIQLKDGTKGWVSAKYADKI